MFKDIQLPKQLIKDGLEQDVLDYFEKNSTPLYPESEIQIPQIPVTPTFHSHIFYAESLGNIEIGFENIEVFLKREKFGIEKAGNSSSRISRILLLSNDGSKRFYKQVEFIKEDRLLVIRLDVPSDEFGKILGLKKKIIKAALITHKSSVANILTHMINDIK